MKDFDSSNVKRKLGHSQFSQNYTPQVRQKIIKEDNQLDRRYVLNSNAKSDESVESQDMDPQCGQLKNEILKKTGKYHPDSTKVQ